MTTPLETVKQLQGASDKGRRGRPGIPGTQKALNAEVLAILVSDAPRESRVDVAVALIKERVLAAYRIQEVAS